MGNEDDKGWGTEAEAGSYRNEMHACRVMEIVCGQPNVSLVPYLGKMAKAILHGSMVMMVLVSCGAGVSSKIRSGGGGGGRIGTVVLINDPHGYLLASSGCVGGGGWGRGGDDDHINRSNSNKNRQNNSSHNHSIL